MNICCQTKGYINAIMTCAMHERVEIFLEQKITLRSISNDENIRKIFIDDNAMSAWSTGSCSNDKSISGRVKVQRSCFLPS
mmetsp:Transcript_9972/g.12284  ORF Transcript_9972/g.12284 Transcript_9972/m.12284 type:complete len:81 (+) Transcript_9972:1029-1271(+)